MEPVVPSLAVPDIEAAVDYYRRNLDFVEALRIPAPGGGTRYATVWNGEATIMFTGIDRVPPEERSCLGGGVELYIDLGDHSVDDYYSEVTGKGVQVVAPLMDYYWGARAFTIADLNGYHVTFAQQVAELTPEQMLDKLEQQA